MSTAPRRPPPRRPPQRGQAGHPPGRAPERAAGQRENASVPVPKPLDDVEIRELQALLDAVPAPLEPLDVSMLDGFLCGVLVQREPVPAARWMPHVGDVEGRPLPRSVDAPRLQALVMRRHAELAAAIGQRRWFDPWVFELANEGDGSGGDVDRDRGGDHDHDDDHGDGSGDDEAAAVRAASEAAWPWVVGIATAFELFPGLTERDDAATRGPLALLYRHLDPDDLEDADALLAEIEAMEPASELADAVEGLVRAVLLLADAARDRG